MRLNRRHLMATGAALPLAAALPRWTLAEMSLGAANVTTVSDGNLVLPGDFVFETMPQDELMTILEATGQSREEVRPECNLTLYRDGTNTVLFDAGAGANFMPSAGELPESLDAVGLLPGDITHVVFTHAHPDHIWGVLDDFGDPLFTKAVHMMGRAEWDYWWDPETVNSIGKARAAFAVGAKNRMEAIEGAIEFFDDGQEILPGIAAVSTPGHTPGHMSFELRNGSETAMVIGDAIGNHHVAFARPEWPSGSDQDPETAITTRKGLFDRLTAENMTLIGFHLPDGGIGRAETTEHGYRFVGKAQ